MSTLGPPHAARKPAAGVGVLDRAIGLLDLVAEGPASLRELAQASGLPRATAHRLLVALEAHGLVARDPAGRFRLGPRLAELGLRARGDIDLAAVAAPVLAALHARAAGAGLRDSVPVGSLLPLDAGSGGKVLLAWSDDGDRFPAVAPAELAAVRRRGWAASTAEREPGVASVSAPVLSGGRLLAALCVSGPVSRIGQAPGRRLATAVQRHLNGLQRLRGPAAARGVLGAVGLG